MELSPYLSFVVRWVSALLAVESLNTSSVVSANGCAMEFHENPITITSIPKCRFILLRLKKRTTPAVRIINAPKIHQIIERSCSSSIIDFGISIPNVIPFIFFNFTLSIFTPDESLSIKNPGCSICNESLISYCKLSIQPSLSTRANITLFTKVMPSMKLRTFTP